MTPAWAVRLAAQVCERAGAKPPVIRWTKHRGKTGLRSSSGTYYTSKEAGLRGVFEPLIVVRAGASREDQKLVLLHELAHHLAPLGAHHGETFWRIAWGLYRRHRMTAFALARELPYRTAASKVALAMGIPRAEEAVARFGVKSRKRGVCPMPEDQAASQGYRTPHTHYWNSVHYYHGPDGSVAYSPGGRR